MSETRKKSPITVRALTVTAMLSAVGFVLKLLDFPLPMLIPSFVKFDVADLPALLASFSLGPVYGVVVTILKELIKMAYRGSFSVGVGELMSIVMGSVFTFTAGFIYHRNKSRKTALIGSLVGAVLMAVLSVPFNYFVTYPAYAAAFGGMEKILKAYQSILPSAGGLLQCLLIFNLPFILVKGLANSLLCFLIYKPLSPILHGKK